MNIVVYAQLASFIATYLCDDTVLCYYLSTVNLFMHFMFMLTATPCRNDERMRLESEMTNASSQVCLAKV